MPPRPPPAPLSELRCADSTFLTYVLTPADLPSLRSDLASVVASHPGAAHVAHAHSLAAPGTGEERWDDGGEPDAAGVGRALSDELTRGRARLARSDTVRIRGGSGSVQTGEDGEEPPSDGGGVPTCVAVVRYFGRRHLGVTSGRLAGVYRRAALSGLRRHATGPDGPLSEDLDGHHPGNLYGLGAGDTELLLDAVEAGDDAVPNLLRELEYEEMVGGDGVSLPRLQNLQADLPSLGPTKLGNLVPVYRYPGNYSGTEWPTRPYSPTSLRIRRSVESALRPLYVQSMNHCVTNLYRHGRDNIQHHSDKDLDLNRDGVIVSVSLGSERVMEIRDRRHPRDVTRVTLPSGSMLVLGPHTNASFTHSILPSEGGDGEQAVVGVVPPGDGPDGPPSCDVGNGGRISLTFRDVRTYLDARTGLLLGQGAAEGDGGPADALEVDGDGSVTLESLARAVGRVRDGRDRDRRSAGLVGLVLGSAAWAASSGGRGGGRSPGAGSLATGAAAGVASCWYLLRLRDVRRREREEAEARRFFSTRSASGNSY